MQKQIDVNFPPLSQAVLRTVVYADIFDYPLTIDEIQRYLTGRAASVEMIYATLQDGGLLPRFLKRAGEYYLLPGREEIVPRRERREKIAARLWPQALRYGRLIARLPFVRMLAVTGSLAMNNVEEDADLDYLVVTKTGRLWLCRALVLALGRAAALRGARLCPNYIISERSLEFPHQSLYTAHELAQMVPLSGLDVYQRIRTLNPWVRHFLPNADGAPPRSTRATGVTAVSRTQSLLEAALLTPPASRLEKWEMERKIRKLRRENENNPEAAFSPDLCKGHFNRHSQRTEHVLRERLERFSLESPQRSSPGLVR
jgi:hypothetical protein